MTLNELCDCQKGDPTVVCACYSELADEISESLEAPPRKASLHELLSLSRAADDGVLDAELDLEALGLDIRDKVDGIVEYLSFLESRAEAFSKLAAPFVKKSLSFQRQRKSLEEYVAFCLNRDKVEREARGEKVDKVVVPGECFQLRLKYSERVEPVSEPTTALYLTHKALIDRTYKWRKGEVKKALKAGDPVITKLAVIKKYPHVDIDPKA